MDIKEVENEVLQEENAYFGERRPSVIRLQGMMKKVSKSPYKNSEFRDNLPSASSPSAADNHTETGMVDESVGNPFHSISQSHGVHRSWRKANPFYVHYKESLRTSADRENGGREDAGVDPDFAGGFGQPTILSPPPEFQCPWPDPSPVNQTVGVSQNGWRDQQGDLFKNMARIETPGLSKPASTPAPSRDLFEPVTSKEWDLFKAPASIEAELFPAPKGDDPFTSPSAEAEDIFRVMPAKEVDIFQSRSTNQEDVFRGPTAVFSADPFEPFPSTDLFQTPPASGPTSQTPRGSPSIIKTFPSRPQDIFQPTTPSNREDVLSSTSQNTDFKVTAPATLSGRKSNVFSDSSLASTPDSFRAMPSVSLTPVPTPPEKQVGTVLPRGTKNGLLQPTPFSQAKSLFETQTPPSLPEQPSPDINQTRTFSRRLPNPVPRKKRATRPSQVAAEPEQAAPIPSPRGRPAVQERKVVNEDSTFQNILLIGQEKCVEDWPTDSPQLGANWKPSGTMRLRRESLRVATDSDGGSGEETQGKHKRVNKLKALLSRKGSKDKPGDDLKQGTSESLRRGSKGKSYDFMSDNDCPRRKSKGDYLDDDFPHKINSPHSEGEHAEKDSGETANKLKARVPHILRRSSKEKSEVNDSGSEQQSSPHQSQEDGYEGKAGVDLHATRRWSEDTGAAKNSEEEDDSNRTYKQGLRRGRKVSVKFVPKRGYSISLIERDDSEMKPENISRRGSKFVDELNNTPGSTPPKTSTDFVFEDIEGAKGYTPFASSKTAFQDEDDPQKGADLFDPEMMDKEQTKIPETKLKKSAKQRWSVVKRQVNSKNSDEDVPTGTQYNSPQSQTPKDDMRFQSNKPKASDWADDYEDFEQQEKRNGKPKKHTKSKAPLVSRRASKFTPDVILHDSVQIGSSCYSPKTAYNDVFLDDGSPRKGADLSTAGKTYEDEEVDVLEKTKPKKTSKFKAYKHRRESKNKAMTEQVPGATSSDFYLSEAAEAEWLAAQMDDRVTAGLEEGDADGDTDSLMEWWNTVEQWDEVQSDEESKNMEVDETKSFTALAEKVQRGLQVFNKVFTENAEVMWQYVYLLYAIADDITEFHKKAKIANVTGGTTTAVGGVAAIAGLALAPFTFGASLIVTAVGVGVATAGGIAAASATISDNVNNMNDRKKIEAVLEDYIARLEAVARILRFVLQGIWRLRAHPLLRAGTQHYSGDWEVRRAVQMFSLVDRPSLRAVEVTDASLAAVEGLFKGLEKYFAKDSSELTKGFKKVIVRQIREVSQVLHEGLVELNGIREELQDANGNV